MSRKSQHYQMKGGLNTETPALSMPSGQLIDCLNYEPVTNNGYRRVDGFERFDGHQLASTAVYSLISFSGGEHAPNIGETLVGGSSFAEGVILDVVVDSGDWSTSDAAGQFVVIVVAGTFLAGEDVTIYHPLAHEAVSHSAAHY